MFGVLGLYNFGYKLEKFIGWLNLEKKTGLIILQVLIIYVIQQPEISSTHITVFDCKAPKLV